MSNNSPFSAIYLAHKFKPIFIFHSEEEYYPCSADYIINNSKMYKSVPTLNNFELISEKITALDLSRNAGDLIIFNEGILKGDLQHSTLYFFAKNESDDFIDLVYFLYFPYRAPLNLFGCFPLNMKRGDVRFVVVRIQKKADFEISSIFFSRASDNVEGSWKNKNEIKVINHIDSYGEQSVHPLIFVSKNSHSFFPTEGTHFGGFGFLNENTNFGKSWTTSHLIYVTENDPEWMRYNGNWEELLPVHKMDWWSKEIMETPLFSHVFPWRYIGELILDLINQIKKIFSRKIDFNGKTKNTNKPKEENKEENKEEAFKSSIVNLSDSHLP
jgi:hypothetical protein